MSTASLNLLKGAKKKALDDELETPKETPVAEETAAAPAEDEGEEVKVDVDKMTGKEIDALVSEHEITVPGDWKKMKVDEKRTWLKKEFNDDSETAAAEASEDTATETDAEAEQPAEEPKAEPKKGKVQIGKKGTAVATSVVKTGEIMQPDQISDIAQEIENLKEADARSLVGQLSEQTELTYFKLGGVLSLIQANGWHAPYGNFRDFVEGEYGINYRKAMYLISIYNNIIEAQVPYEKVKHLGWTKLKEIASILTNENLDKWVKLAEKHTALQLADLVAQEKKQGQTSLPSGESPTSAVVTKTFKLHADQKETVEAAIAKAKKAAGTEVDSAALEFICLEYINTSQKKAPKEKTLEELMKGKSAEEVLTTFGEVFPDVTISAEI